MPNGDYDRDAVVSQDWRCRSPAVRTTRRDRALFASADFQERRCQRRRRNSPDDGAVPPGIAAFGGRRRRFGRLEVGARRWRQVVTRMFCSALSPAKFIVHGDTADNGHSRTGDRVPTGTASFIFGSVMGTSAVGAAYWPPRAFRLGESVSDAISLRRGCFRLPGLRRREGIHCRDRIMAFSNGSVPLLANRREHDQQDEASSPPPPFETLGRRRAESPSRCSRGRHGGGDDVDADEAGGGKPTKEKWSRSAGACRTVVKKQAKFVLVRSRWSTWGVARS